MLYIKHLFIGIKYIVNPIEVFLITSPLAFDGLYIDFYFT